MDTERKETRLDPADVQSYMARDWEAVREAKDDYWAKRIRLLGPREGVRVGDELRRQALLLGGGSASVRERLDDLQAHARLSELLARASATRGR